MSETIDGVIAPPMTYAITPLTREKISELEARAPAMVLAAQCGMRADLTADEALSLIQFALWNRDRLEPEPTPMVSEGDRG